MAKTKNTKKTPEKIELVETTAENLEKLEKEFVEAKKDAMIKPVMESIARPFDKTVEINEELNETYPFALRDLTGVQRAILCELVRIRKALEK